MEALRGGLCAQYGSMGVVSKKDLGVRLLWHSPARNMLCQQREGFGKVANRRLLCKAASDTEARDSAVSNEIPTKGSQSRRNELDCVGTGSDVECFVADTESEFKAGGDDIDCVAIGNDVECLVADSDRSQPWMAAVSQEGDVSSTLAVILDGLLLISPFFFWGTAMVAMKDVLPKAGPLFVAAVRLIPAGILLVIFASSRGRKFPNTPMAWISILVFALVDGACFQGCLSEGLRRTSAGLGSVIIDSQPLTVAILAAILFGESIGTLGVIGLITGVVGLCLLEVPLELAESFFSSNGLEQIAMRFSGTSEEIGSVVPFSLWDSGEWWMLLAAQSMAVGTILVRWVCRYNDPIMATGWHMILGGIPLLLLSLQLPDPIFTGHIGDLSPLDWSSLFYTSLFGSAISYGVFFFNASKGNLTKLSSLTFLTPMFAAVFGYIYLGETLSPLQFVGALVTVVAITLVNVKTPNEKALEKKNS